MKKLILLGIFALSLTVNAGYLEDGNLYYKNQNYDTKVTFYHDIIVLLADFSYICKWKNET